MQRTTLAARPVSVGRRRRRLELVGYLVAADLVPVDLGARDGQSASQRLERRLRHGLIVLRDGVLVLVLRLLDRLHDRLGRLLVVAHGDHLLGLFVAHQLHVAVLVVVYLDFEYTVEFDVFSLGWRKCDCPSGPPSGVPEVVFIDRYNQ